MRIEAQSLRTKLRIESCEFEKIMSLSLDLFLDKLNEQSKNFTQTF